MSRVAVVTGAASGMGLAAGRRLAADGNRVALLDLDGEAHDPRRRRAAPTGSSAIGLEVDVTDRATVDDAMAKVRSEFGPIEIIVTSAGFDEFRPFTDITLDAWEHVLTVDLTGTFHCVQSAIPDMLAGGWGRIVTISS